MKDKKKLTISFDNKIRNNDPNPRGLIKPNGFGNNSTIHGEGRNSFFISSMLKDNTITILINYHPSNNDRNDETIRIFYIINTLCQSIPWETNPFLVFNIIGNILNIFFVIILSAAHDQSSGKASA